MSTQQPTSQTSEISAYADEREVLDRDELLQRCLGNFEFVERILDRFSEDFETKLDGIRELSKSREVYQLHQLAHQMKGTAANIAAHRIQACLCDLERSIDEETWDSLDLLIDSLECEFRGFQKVRQTPAQANTSSDPSKQGVADHE